MSDGNSSSDEEIPNDVELKHAVNLRLDLGTAEDARIVCSVLAVDKEPKRSNAVREFKQEGQFLIISVRSKDRRSLQKSAANLQDMCDLAMSTLEMTRDKKWMKNVGVEPSMFKGLKSKLEDGAKKLQTNVQSTVNQYSEQLSQQFREIGSAASDAGSDAGSTASRRFGALDSSGTLNHSVGNALMEEVTEADLLGLDSMRQRRDSTGSNHSNESSLSALFVSVPGLTGSSAFLDTIDSDMESITDGETSSGFQPRTPRELGYKNRYVELVRKYNQVVTENNKCRTILQQSQDKAIGRIRKLKEEKKILSDRLSNEESTTRLPDATRSARYEEMLEKAKGEIARLKNEVSQLSHDKHSLISFDDAAPGVSVEMKRYIEGTSGILKEQSDSTASRIAAEWKERLQQVEEQWTERLNKADQDSAITLATIDSLRAKCRELEIQDGQANERWQKKVDELKASLMSLETEKAEQLEKLSEAKTQGVTAVLEEEEAKRKELRRAMEEEVRVVREECEARLKEVEVEAEKRVHQVSEQLERGAIEKKSNEESEEIQDLRGELETMEKKLREAEARRADEAKLMEEAIEKQLNEHRKDIAQLVKEHEEIVITAREQHEAQLKGADERYQHVRHEAEHLRVANDDMERRLATLTQSLDVSTTTSSSQMATLTSEVEDLRAKLEDVAAESIQRLKEIGDARKDGEVLRGQLEEMRECLEGERAVTEDNTLRWQRAEKAAGEELSELRAMLDERNTFVRRLEGEKESLEIELASARELSAIHETLRGQLQDAIASRNEAEVRLLDMESRVAGAEAKLAEERQRIEDERDAVEKLELTHSLQATASEAQRSAIDFSRGEEVERLQECLARLEENLAKAKEEVAESEKAKTQLQGELEVISSSLKELQSHLHKSQESRAADNDQLRNELEELRSLNDGCLEELAGKAKRLMEMEEELRKARDDSTANEARVKEAADAVAAAEKLAGDASMAIDQENKLLVVRIDELSAALEEQNNAVEREGKAAMAQMAALEGQVREAKNEAEAASQRAVSLDALQTAEASAKELAQKKVVEMEGALAAARSECTTLESRASDFETRVSDLVEALEETRQQRNEMETKLRETLAVVERNEADSNFKEGIAEELRVEATRASENAARLQLEVDSLQQRVDELEQQILMEKSVTKVMEEKAAKAEEILAKEKKEKEEGDVARGEVENLLRDEERKGEEARKDREEVLRKLQELQLALEESKSAVVSQQKEHEVALAAATASAEGDREEAKREAEQRDKQREEHVQMEEELRESIRKLERRVDEGEVAVARGDQALAAMEERAQEMSLLAAQREAQLQESSRTLQAAQEELEKFSSKDEKEHEAKAKSAKQDMERQALVRELQKEVKTLYGELSEKQKELDSAKDRIRGLEEWQDSEDAGAGEDAEKMRTRAEEAEREATRCREAMQQMQKASTATRVEPPVHVESTEDHTDAEYLRNVLFKYMNERETLGREMVTLARVIGTVARFEKSQLAEVIAKEEARTSGWLPLAAPSKH